MPTLVPWLAVMSSAGATIVHGGLGDGDNGSRVSPTPVAVVGVTNATAIAAGYFHTCALVSGDVKCWGFNRFGQVGVNPGWVPEDVLAGTGE